MKKILILILITTCLVSFGYAQSMMRVGAQLMKGGVKNSFGGSINSKLGFGFSGEYLYRIQKIKEPILFSGGVIIYNTNSNNDSKLYNLQIPLIINVELGKKFKVDLGLGGFYNYLFAYNLSANTRLLESSINKHGFGLIGRFGAKYQLPSKGYLGLNGSYSHTMTTTCKTIMFGASGDYFIDASSVYFSFGVFYQFAFKNKKQANDE